MSAMSNGPGPRDSAHLGGVKPRLLAGRTAGRVEVDKEGVEGLGGELESCLRALTMSVRNRVGQNGSRLSGSAPPLYPALRSATLWRRRGEQGRRSKRVGERSRRPTLSRSRR